MIKNHRVPLFHVSKPKFFVGSEFTWHKFSLRADVYSRVMKFVNDREVKGR